MSDVTVIPSAPRRSTSPESDAAPEAPPAYRGDVAVYRIVVVILGLVTLAATGGALFCEMGPASREIPQFLIALGSGALGSLAGLLAPSPVGR